LFSLGISLYASDPEKNPRIDQRGASAAPLFFLAFSIIHIVEGLQQFAHAELFN
jgi:hypothetical protein